MSNAVKNQRYLEPGNLLLLTKELDKKLEGQFVFKNTNLKGKPLKEWENLKDLIEHHGIKVHFNEITKQIDVTGLKVHLIDDVVCDIHSLCQKSDFQLTQDSIGRMLGRISTENSYNPVAEYLDEAYAQWDKKPGRVDAICKTLIVDDAFDRFFRDKLVKKWLVNAVMIAYNEGKTNTEGVLILQGAQGKGKTTWIKSLIPNELNDYFKEGMRLVVGDKDSIYESITNWIVELGELDGTLKKDQAGLKAFFNSPVDVQRRPYDKATSQFPRRTAFFGTVNKDEFLKDETGDRRYWVIPIVDIKRDFLSNDELKQFWGEVMHLWKSKEVLHYLDQMELEALNKSNKQYRVMTHVEVMIEEGFDWSVDEMLWTGKTATEISLRLGLSKNNTSTSGFLISRGAIKKRTSSGVKYVTPPFKI